METRNKQLTNYALAHGLQLISPPVLAQICLVHSRRTLIASLGAQSYSKTSHSKPSRVRHLLTHLLLSLIILAPCSSLLCSAKESNLACPFGNASCTLFALCSIEFPACKKPYVHCTGNLLLSFFFKSLLNTHFLLDAYVNNNEFSLRGGIDSDFLNI